MDALEIDGVTFHLDNRPGAQRAISRDCEFVLVKSPRLLSFYEGLCEDPPKAILEIGMFEGGSLVYFDKLFEPDVLVGIDLRRQPIEALEQYRSTRPHIKTYYGRSQNSPHTRGAAQSNFPNGIDLVVDDASHLYAETLETFENIFPLVRPGGLYVIEDWAWAHKASAQAPGSTWYDRPAMTNLLFALTVMAASHGVIDSLTIERTHVCVRKGRGMLPPGKMDISHLLRGRTLPLI